MAFGEYMITVFFPTLWDRLWTIISAPAYHPGMVWILFPMIITLLLMTFYFGRYRREELGWNTAFGNAIVLLFVSINLVQVIFPDENPFRALLIFLRRLFTVGLGGEGVLPGIVAGVILLYACILLASNFFHLLPKKLAFFISSGLPINVLAYFGIIFVYERMTGNPITLDWFLLLAFFILFIALYLFLKLLQLIEPHRDDAELVEDAPKPSKDQKIVRQIMNDEPFSEDEFKQPVFGEGIDDEVPAPQEPSQPPENPPSSNNLYNDRRV